MVNQTFFESTGNKNTFSLSIQKLDPPSENCFLDEISDLPSAAFFSTESAYSGSPRDESN